MKNNDGMTLVEVIVSVMIVFIFFMGTTAGGLIVLDQNTRNDQRDEAIHIAEEVMAGMRNTPYVDIMLLNNVGDNVVRYVRGKEMRYNFNQTVKFLDPGAELAELGVAVNWTRMERGVGGVQPKVYTHTLNTIVRR